MKIIYQGDMHLRDGRPINRTDDYFDAEFRKLVQLNYYVLKYDAMLLLGGDLFDTHKVSHRLVNRVLDSFLSDNIKGYTVLGQHDVPYHDVDLMKSPVGILHQAGVLEVLEIYKAFEENVVVHPASWEQTPTPPWKDSYNIFLGHVSVFKKIPHYWTGEGYTPKTLKEKYPGYDLYLCGDIHEPLVDGNVVVSGSMMRQNINQINERPRCYLIDTETGDIEPQYYVVDEDVFNVPIEKSDTSLDLDRLVKALKDSSIGKSSYERDCLAMANSFKEVKPIIQEIFDDLD